MNAVISVIMKGRDIKFGKEFTADLTHIKPILNSSCHNRCYCKLLLKFFNAIFEESN